MPKKIIVFENKDKDPTKEEWNEKRMKNPANKPSPFRWIIAGGVSRGKTNLIKNVLINQKPRWTRICLLHHCINEDGSILTREYEDIDGLEYLTDIPDKTFFTNEDKNLLIIDDMDFGSLNKEQMNKMIMLFRYISSHQRVSILCSIQDYYMLPIELRKLSNIITLYKPNDWSSLTSICKKLGISLDDMKHIFKEVLPNVRDNLTIDLSPNCPEHLKMTKNLFEPIVENK